MNASLLAVLNDPERLLVAETERAPLAVLDEDAAIELATRIRRARNKYVGQYRRAARAARQSRGPRSGESGEREAAGKHPRHGCPAAGEAGQPMTTGRCRGRRCLRLNRLRWGSVGGCGAPGRGGHVSELRAEHVPCGSCRWM
jgi:hypothetical protein